MRNVPWLAVFSSLVAVLGLAAGAAAGTGRGGRSGLDRLAGEYVRLVLAIGRHDASYVDAYYGPREWREEAGRGEPAPLPELLARARELLGRVEGTSERAEFLRAQLRSVEGFLRRLAGERMPLDEEARLLFDITPPSHSPEEFAASRERLETLLPGEGDLAQRVEAFKGRFVVPGDRVEVVLRAALDLGREATARHARLPREESCRCSLVKDKPWAAYNWYQGGLRSLIEVNVDLPIELEAIARTMFHEGYPGHHTYNVLLEDRLVRGRGWLEFTVYPLYSPQSLLAEGTANAGRRVLLDDEQWWEALRGRLAPLAGLENRDFATYRAVLEALRPLRHARGEAARMLLDRGRSEEEVIAFLVRHELTSEARARRALDFIRTYRSYVFNYSVGEDLVVEYLGDGPDRAARFFDLLQRPVTPSRLVPTGGPRDPGAWPAPGARGRGGGRSSASP